MQLQVCLPLLCPVLCRYISSILYYSVQVCIPTLRPVVVLPGMPPTILNAFKYYVEGSRAGMLQLQIINNRKKCNETIQKSKKKIMNKFFNKIKIFKIFTSFPLKNFWIRAWIYTHFTRRWRCIHKYVCAHRFSEALDYLRFVLCLLTSYNNFHYKGIVN